MPFMTLRSIPLCYLLLAWAGSSRGETFTLLVFESADALALRSDPGEAGQRYWSDYAQYGKRLQDSGVLRGGTALKPLPQVSTGGAVLGGYFLIDVADRAQAERLAADAPSSQSGGRTVVAESAASLAMPEHSH